jgi:hypothetical protein
VFPAREQDDRMGDAFSKQSGTRTTWQNAEPHLAYEILDPSKE